VPVATVFSEHQFDPGLLPQAVDDLIQDLQRGGTSPKNVVFAGRNLYVALRDEAVNNVVAESKLGPIPRYTLAARCSRALDSGTSAFADATGSWAGGKILEVSSAGAFRVSASVATDGELLLILSMRDRGVRYPFEQYPEIREFEAMLRQLQPGQIWEGVHFRASAEATEAGGQPLFHFCRHSDRVLFTFVEAEWRCLNELFMESLSKPRSQTILERLTLEYGEV
jgi:hypothetical protein